jgi:aspartyl-tRNA(Asn)/glutamyl-tRNA(Gln) amidotransferase subunit A
VSPLHATRAVDLSRSFRRGEVTAAEIADRFLERTRRLDPELNAFVSLDEASIRARAEALDRKRSRGQSLGRLAAMPVALKDNISERGATVTCGSRMLRAYRAPFDAHVTERLREEDALLFGRTNLDEFAMGSTGETSIHGRTLNPWRRDRVPGGSSSGSAAAVAARMVPLALGSDTGGSIRLPAAFCGVLGLKPTYGRVSRHGLVAYGSSLDQIGPIGHDPEDLAILLEAIAGPDARDATCGTRSVEGLRAALDRGVGGLRLGLPEGSLDDGVEPEVRDRVSASLAALRELGARVEPVRLRHAPFGIPVYYLIATSEASSNLARFDGVHYGHRAPSPDSLYDLYSRSRGEGFGREVTRRIALGTFALSEGYRDAFHRKALQVRTLIRRDLEDAFHAVDAIVGPTSPIAGLPLGAALDDPETLYRMDVMTVSANLAGLPAVSLPAGFTSQGLPVGLQAMAPPFAETMLCRIAGALARVTDHHRREPIA